MGAAAGAPRVSRAEKALIAAELARQVRTAAATFEPKLSRLLNSLLADFIERDRGLLSARLDAIRALLKPSFGTTLDLQFGGSIAKRTYIEGLSDVDCLVIDDRWPEKREPKVIMQLMAEALAPLTDIGNGMAPRSTIGRMALTLTYADGTEVQLLPAIALSATRLLLPSGTGWIDVGTENFVSALRALDARSGMKLIPTIKLAKAINARQPAGMRLSGYHIETLAVEAFADYRGRMTTAEMLPEFFARASELIDRPIRDSSAQSTFVDDHLGPADSTLRKRLALNLDNIRRTMLAASRDHSSLAWLRLFGMEDEDSGRAN